MTNLRKSLVAQPGQDVLVLKRGSPMFDKVGETVGPADTQGGRLIRVNFDGEIYVFHPEDLEPL